jgi:hypothetical protein
MASLGDNPIWSSVNGGTASAQIMGPSYSYVDNIQSPSALGVGSDGSISQLARNTGGIIQYVQYLISGPALGNRFFVNTGGSCKASDGTIQSRYNYINNVTDAAEALPESMRRDLGGLASDFNGLIPGMIQDVGGLNPVNLFSSLAADSTPSCDCYSCPTTNGSESHFLTTSLSPDFDADLCQPADIKLCKASGGGTQESFTNFNLDLNNKNSLIPVMIALFGIFYLRSI